MAQGKKMKHGIRNGTGDVSWGKRDGVDENKKMGKMKMPNKAKALKALKGEKQIGSGKIEMMKKKVAKKTDRKKLFSGALSKLKGAK